MNSWLDVSPWMTCKSRQPGGLVDAGGEEEPPVVVAGGRASLMKTCAKKHAYVGA